MRLGAFAALKASWRDDVETLLLEQALAISSEMMKCVRMLQNLPWHNSVQTLGRETYHHQLGGVLGGGQEGGRLSFSLT
jgi:hypothetical protein